MKYVGQNMSEQEMIGWFHDFFVGFKKFNGIPKEYEQPLKQKFVEMVVTYLSKQLDVESPNVEIEGLKDKDSSYVTHGEYVNLLKTIKINERVISNKNLNNNFPAFIETICHEFVHYLQHKSEEDSESLKFLMDEQFQKQLIDGGVVSKELVNNLDQRANNLKDGIKDVDFSAEELSSAIRVFGLNLLKNEELNIGKDFYAKETKEQIRALCSKMIFNNYLKDFDEMQARIESKKILSGFIETLIKTAPNDDLKKYYVNFRNQLQKSTQKEDEQTSDIKTGMGKKYDKIYYGLFNLNVSEMMKVFQKIDKLQSNKCDDYSETICNLSNKVISAILRGCSEKDKEDVYYSLILSDDKDSSSYWFVKNQIRDTFSEEKLKTIKENVVELLSINEVTENVIRNADLDLDQSISLLRKYMNEKKDIYVQQLIYDITFDMAKKKSGKWIPSYEDIKNTNLHNFDELKELCCEIDKYLDEYIAGFDIKNQRYKLNCFTVLSGNTFLEKTKKINEKGKLYYLLKTPETLEYVRNLYGERQAIKMFKNKTQEILNNNKIIEDISIKLQNETEKDK